ncbi:MAG: hypothetical protein QOF61_2747 [Acidobacteriota bacterium]|jgi:hypothetical protein|nr:hypothetical protein [Acidobacteriota bacterium]
MTERCNNCGTELFAGQQFCRQCGAPTRQFSSAEIPTQILPGAPAPPQTAQPPYAGTTPLGARETDPVYHSRFAQQYQPPGVAPAALPTQTAQLQRKRSRRGWLIGLLCFLVLFLCGSFLAAQFIVDQFRRKVAVARAANSRALPSIPSLPSMPSVPGVPGMGAPDTADLSPLDEAGAEVSGDKTVITKTFPLSADATFSLAQVSGDVTIEGWDQNQAQVTITKEGGDAEDRAGVEIMHAATAKNLTLRTPEDTDTVKQIKYEIKLPRALREIRIDSQDSDVTLSNLAGNVAINLMRGNISVSGLTGAVATHAMKGNVSVDLKNASPAASQVFNTVSGNIALKVGGANAQVKAETIDGGISADDDLDLSVIKQLPGEHAAGTLGKGGQAIVAKTVSGNIKIKQ